jgi:hypothetical protein
VEAGVLKMILWYQNYSRNEILQRVGSIRQLAGAEACELVDGSQRGVRAVRLWNAAGLDVTVLGERGMSIGAVSVQGVPLAWTSPVGAAHPGYLENQPLGWLRTWPGGFLTTCGLTQVGAPVVDGDQTLGLHGRAANLPASGLSWGGEWKGNDYIVWVEGTILESAVFGEHLALKRRIWTGLAEPVLWIDDQVENLGFQPTPHMFLQHINLGFPLVDTSTLLSLPVCRTTARDEIAKAGMNAFLDFQPPTPGYLEQVFYHEDMAADAAGLVEVRLTNPAFDRGRGLAVSLRFNPAEYPVLVEWKMMGEGMYVVGLEPANCHVEGRARERARGSLQVLEPGEKRSYHLRIDFETS